MAPTLNHPTPELLRAFGAGRLPADEQARVEEHIRDCSQCCAELVANSGDTLADLARDAARTPVVQKDSSTTAIPHELRDHPRYRILGLLGEGGMGVVFKAEHQLMGRVVALKVISQRLTASADAVERFRREVKAAARLNHPNIVTAHDAEEADGLHFLVMEYVEGVSLDRLVAKRGPLPVPLACHLIRQAAAGLQHAHQSGMVHRDIKPHNLMVTRKGQVKILDFGLARLNEEGRASRASVTAPNLVVGTPDFLAPEQARDSRRVDIRADLYALGCTLYFLLTGRVPFAGESPFEKLLAHTNSVAVDVSEIRADIPSEVAALVNRLMAKDPADRFQTPAELANTLGTILRGASDINERVDLPEAEPATSHATAELSREATPVIPTAATRPVRSLQRRPRRTRRTRGTDKVVVLAAVASVLLVALLILLVAFKPWRGRGATDDPALAAVPTKSSGYTTQPVTNGARRHQVLLVVPKNDLFFPDLGDVQDALRSNPVDMHIASSQAGPIGFYSANGIDGRPPGGQQVFAGVSLSDPIDVNKYDAVIFVGALVDEFIGDDVVGRNTRALIAAMNRPGKVVASLCTGLRVLLASGVVDDCPSVPQTPQWDYVSRGISRRWETSDDVVTYGNVVMASNHVQSRAFVSAIGQKLKR